MSELKNILNNGPEPSEEALKKYLEGSASAEERFMIENQMSNEDFMNDAVEGLQHFKSPLIMQDYVNKINKDLVKHTSKKKNNKLRSHIEDQHWTLIAVIFILLLCLLGYFVIHLSLNFKPINKTIEQKK